MNCSCFGTSMTQASIFVLGGTSTVVAVERGKFEGIYELQLLRHINDAGVDFCVRRDQHGVDDVHHAVGGVDISSRDLSFAVDEHATPVYVHQQALALESLHVLGRFEVFTVDSRARNHVIFENRIQQLDVFGV